MEREELNKGVRIIFCEVVAIYGEAQTGYFRSLEANGIGVIMAIVFSGKINGDVQDMYTANNYYTGTFSSEKTTPSA